MPINKQDIEHAMRSIFIIKDGKIFIDSKQEKLYNNLDSSKIHSEWKEIYDDYVAKNVK